MIVRGNLGQYCVQVKVDVMSNEYITVLPEILQGLTDIVGRWCVSEKL
jgi:hypothetical protein